MKTPAKLPMPSVETSCFASVKYIYKSKNIQSTLSSAVLVPGKTQPSGGSNHPHENQYVTCSACVVAMGSMLLNYFMQGHKIIKMYIIKYFIICTPFLH